MCFVFILTENKWYIFFKKEIKCHTEKVCGIVKGANVQTKTLKWTLINQTSDERSDRKKKKNSIITSSAPNLCSDHASSNKTAYLADLREQFSMTLKGILSNISSVLAHVNFKYHFTCNLLISFTYQDSLVKLAYLCCWCCHREHTWVKDYVWLHWLGTVCYFSSII